MDGNSTVQGTCPETNQVCNPDGNCTGTVYYRPHTKIFIGMITILDIGSKTVKTLNMLLLLIHFSM